MTAPTSLLAYSDCLSVMEQALEYKQGVRVKCADEGQARNFRMRVHKARAIDREENTKIYAEGHRLYGRSIYDQLFLRISNEDGVIWLNFERRTLETMEIEPLGGPNGDQSDDRDHRAVEGESEGERAEGESSVESATPEVESLFEPEETQEEATPGAVTRRF